MSRLSNGDSLTDDDRTLSRHERSHLNHRASKSPSLNGEARIQDEDRALASAAADIASLGMDSRGSHALSTEASGVSPRTRERGSMHAVHANSVTGSEKEWNNEENVASPTRAMATLDQGSQRSLNARERRRRQDDANNTFNEFASLPASTAHGDITPHASSAQHTDPHLSTGSRTRDPSKVLPSTTELDLAVNGRVITYILWAQNMARSWVHDRARSCNKGEGSYYILWVHTRTKSCSKQVSSYLYPIDSQQS